MFCGTLIIIILFRELIVMSALDTLRAFWIFAVFLLIYLWLPLNLCTRKPEFPRIIQIAGNLARTVLCLTILVFVLSSLRVLGAMTALLVFLAALAVGWFRKRAGTPERLLTNLQAITINAVRQVESQSFAVSFPPGSFSFATARRIARLRANSWLEALKGKELLGASFLVVLGITIVLRAEHAVRELRFDQPEQYSALLRARELMLNTHSAGRPFIYPAMIATTSLLSSMDPTQVMRFLTPAIGVLVVLAAGALIQVCLRAGVASLATIYCLGAAAFPPMRNHTGVAKSAIEKVETAFQASTRNGPEFAIGCLFFLLALILLAHWNRNSRNWDSLLDFACCLMLTAIVSPRLLLVLLISAGVLLVRPTLGLLTFVMVCCGWIAWATFATGMTVPDEMRAILPLAAAILVGCFLGLMESVLVTRSRGIAQTVILAACLCIAVILLPPQKLQVRYLEYEAAARATQEIADKFPRQTWVVAAPVEQLAETLGLGGYEDLAGFVEKYRRQISSRDFVFQDAREDLFIYVEKKPFQIFSREPESVSFSVLTDPTYRNYRSPGGRASLEAAALQICENYRQYHSGTDVFFEDEVLRIYHIHRQQALEANVAARTP